MSDVRRGPEDSRLQLPESTPEKPRLRGLLHQCAFAVSVPAGVALVLAARPGVPRLAAAIYALSLAGLYGTSAAFHRGRWSPVWQRRMDQADHAMIYVLIAGTYTPLALLALGRAWGTAILSIVWTAALAGVLVVILWHRIRFFGIVMYLTLGWLGAVILPWVAGRLGVTRTTLLIAGGLLYTVGAVVLIRQRPNPNPAVLGYHEIWHGFTVLAGLCHFILVWTLVTTAW